jgi:hypothetical protein
LPQGRSCSDKPAAVPLKTETNSTLPLVGREGMASLRGGELRCIKWDTPQVCGSFVQWRWREMRDWHSVYCRGFGHPSSLNVFLKTLYLRRDECLVDCCIAVFDD